MFSSEHRQELASCLKTLLSHTAGSSSSIVHSGQIQQAAFRRTVSSGSAENGRSHQYFIIRLGSFNGRPRPVEYFFERARVQIGLFFIMTGTGPKTIVLAFLLNLNLGQDLYFFSQIGCDLIPSKIIIGKVLVSLKSAAELPYLGCQDFS